MREITKTYNVYSYNELSEEGKEKVRQWYLEGQEPYFFTEMCLEKLAELFPKSELKVQYSLNSCQGDGLNIYGKIYLDEVLENIKDQFTEKELKFFKWLFDRYGSSYELKSNNHYCYCICSMCHDFLEDYIYYMKDENMKNIPKATFEKFNRLVGKYLDTVCADYEEAGYNYFYEVEESDLEEWAEANEYEFYEDGRIAC